MKNGTCPKCGAAEVLAGVRVGTVTGGSGLQLEAGKGPAAWLSRRLTSELRAWTCAACGYTELYATGPAALGKPRPAPKDERIQPGR